MSAGQTRAKRSAGSRERERSRIQDRFGVVLLLLMITVFFSVSAPNEPWAWLATTVTLAASVIIAVSQAGDARRYLSLTSALLTLLAMAAIVQRVRMHAEISLLTVLGAVCFYVL